jgi:hypothetical protein
VSELNAEMMSWYFPNTVVKDRYPDRYEEA